MTRHARFGAGIRVSCWLFAGATLLYFLRMALSYDGKCGGFIPGLSAPRDCSLWSYLTGDVLAIALILLVTWWPFAAAALVLPPALGYVLDRRAGQRE